MPVSIVFNQINVNSMEFNASVSTGQNNQMDWSTSGKQNFGNGIEVGIVFSSGIINIINDNDLIDSAFSEPEIVNPQPNIQQ